MWLNSRHGYGRVSITLHWVIAIAIVGLFALGLWMTGLSYAHPWYTYAPFIHESVGMIVLALIGLRLVWRVATVTPPLEPGMPAWERVGALGAHWTMYALMVIVVVSGYLIPTADGSPVSVFGWLEVPALVQLHPRQADYAGWVHYWGAWGLIGLAALHTTAALKHHFIDRDRTLLRMLQARPGPSDPQED